MDEHFESRKDGHWHRGFMIWRCCGKVWRCQIRKMQPERKNLRQVCDVCGSVGKSFNDLFNERR